MERDELSKVGEPRPGRKSPRRETHQPQQERSQQTVDAILTAAKLIVCKQGLAAMTTSAVARRAGVSSGSLYQYFPGKRAILLELRRRHQAHGKAIFLAEAAALLDEPVAVAVRRFIEKLFEVHRIDPDLHRALELAGKEHGVGDWERQAIGIVRMYFERHRSELVVSDVDRAAFIVAAAAEALTHGAVLERPDLLHDGKLVDDIVCMLVRYLTGRDADGRTPALPRAARDEG